MPKYRSGAHKRVNSSIPLLIKGGENKQNNKKNKPPLTQKYSEHTKCYQIEEQKKIPTYKKKKNHDTSGSTHTRNTTKRLNTDRHNQIHNPTDITTPSVKKRPKRRGNRTLA